MLAGGQACPLLRTLYVSRTQRAVVVAQRAIRAMAAGHRLFSLLQLYSSHQYAFQYLVVQTSWCIVQYGIVRAWVQAALRQRAIKKRMFC